MLRFFNKIVRDGMKEVVARDGKKEVVARDGNSAAFTHLDGPALIAALERKLAEEVAEYLESHSPEELGDVQDTLYALIRARGDSKAVDEARCRKYDERGGFDTGLYMIFG